jgi:hypothetical protein
MFEEMIDTSGITNHVMTLYGAGDGKIVTRTATANFSPHALTLHSADPDLGGPERPIFLKQLTIRGQPQLKEPVPDFVLAGTGHLARRPGWRNPALAPMPGGAVPQFTPILDMIELGDEVVAECEPSSARFTLMLHGQLDLESYVRRLVESGRVVNRRAIAARADKVQPGETRRCTLSPQVLFKATHISVSPECAPHFDIAGIGTGKDALFVTHEPIAATLFPPIPDEATEARRREIEERLRLAIPLVVPGVCLSIEVINTSREVRDFRGAFHGYMF